MSMRTRHGNARRTGTGPVIEVLPANEQPPAQAAGPDPIATGRDSAGKLRTSEAARALAKLPRRSRHVPRRLACDPRFEPHNARRLEWQKKRVAELQAAHGGVSHGVGAMLSAAAWLYAAGEFAAEQAAESGNLDGFRAAATLTSTARQHELAAWELGAREAQQRQHQQGDTLAQEQRAFQRRLAQEAERRRLTEASTDRDDPADDSSVPDVEAAS